MKTNYVRSTKTHRMWVRLSAHEHGEILKAAQDEGMSMSKYIRERCLPSV